MMISCCRRKGSLRALPFGCFWLNGCCCGFRLRRKCRVAFAVDEEAVTGALLVGEGGADALAFLLAVALDGVEDVEGRYLFLFGRFGLCCHRFFSFFVFEQIPEGMSPRRCASGRGVTRKIGGNLQGEPRLPVYATSARAWQGSDDAKGVFKTRLQEKGR